ncbi:ribonuclease Z [Bradyrhizobium sediminis]|uniref:Ribonuclease Z n=1 Tax=Bradyrhizobium sediminis TaxID=2840469 RepID=A0A975NSI8_9BRAD|nr:MBL fold metallo-hydrolase [Bradyrhizobium sediminis]QWG20567.1 ribonuclease Z [Bradyrhizobium sediminis]
MRPLLHATLINGRTGDPALYLETLFEKRAILFDLGDIALLPPRKILRLEHVLVSHAHVDHFIGFDRLLRVLVGRDKQIHLYGPNGFADRVHHKLQAYLWNLVDRGQHDLVFVVTEIDASLGTRMTRFRFKAGFAAEAMGTGRIDEGVVVRDPAFRVSTAVLAHRTPCLGFAVQEPAHVNIWKTRLARLGLPVGHWLRDLKRAVIENRPDDFPVRIGASTTGSGGHEMPLGKLRDVLTITPGQKIGYVTDVADTADNRKAITALVGNADLLFIEAAFARADADLAADRAHLTTEAAGQIARQAGVRRIEPFHFSSRYPGQEERMLNEVMAAFAGQSPE